MTEKQFIEVENREEVAAVHHQTDSNDWIFFCHGYGSNKENSYEMRARKAAESGFNAVRFDFRGNGESDGEFIDQNLSSRIKDLKTVIDHFGPENFFLFGMSFGGKVVLHGAEDLQPEGLVLKSPVSYNSIMDKFREVVDEKGEYTHFGDKTIDQRFFDDFDSYSFSETAEEIDSPVIIFHGGADTTVKFANSAEVAKELDNDLTLRKMKDEKHSMTDEAESKLVEEMLDWLSDLR